MIDNEINILFIDCLIEFIITTFVFFEVRNRLIIFMNMNIIK